MASRTVTTWSITIQLNAWAEARRLTANASLCFTRVPRAYSGRGDRSAKPDGRSMSFRWRPCPCEVLRALLQNVLDDLTPHVGQAEVTPAEAIRQPGVVDAELVQNGRVPVIH